MKKRNLAIFITIAFVFTIALIFVPTTVCFATDGEVIEEVQPTAGEFIRNWVYMQADSLTVGTIVTFLMSTVGGLILRNFKKKNVASNSVLASQFELAVKQLESSNKTIYELRTEITSILEQTKALKVDKAINEIVKSATEIEAKIEELPIVEEKKETYLRS